MKLGSSLERRRRGTTGSRKRARRRRRNRRRIEPLIAPRTWGWIGGLALAGWLVGYGLSTRVLFPAPPPPANLQAVPDLRGSDMAFALSVVEGEGLHIGAVEYLTHPRADSGSVLGQSPLPGQLILPGDSIRVTVSLGAERRAVPEVSRLRGDRAIALLRATGFAVRVDSVESPEPRGRILRVDPAEGEELTLPGSVTLEVSLGPPAVVMPDLIRLAEEEARDTLDALGLVVAEVEEVFRFGRDQGRVVAQDPPAGDEVERGSAVRLVVGRRTGRR